MFQIDVFDDPGVEMLPEAGGCMCYNNHKHRVFEWFHVSTDSQILCPQEGFGVSCWGVLVTLETFLVNFKGIGGELEFCYFFRGFPGRTQAEATHPFGGNGTLQG